MTRTLDLATSPAAPAAAHHAADEARRAGRAVLDGAGFLLLCLWTRRSPAAARQDLAGWDAGFGPA